MREAYFWFGIKISGLVNRRTRMALNHEKKVRHLYPLFGFHFFHGNLRHLRRKAVIKGASNAPGGFGACPIWQDSAESSTINNAETGEIPVMGL